LANLVIEASGNAKALESVFEIVEPGGQITILGLYLEKSVVSFEKVVLSNLTVKGVLSSSGAIWPETIKLIESGKVDPSKLISHKIPLEKFSSAVKILEQKIDNVLKIVIVQDPVAKL